MKQIGVQLNSLPEQRQSEEKLQCCCSPPNGECRRSSSAKGSGWKQLLNRKPEDNEKKIKEKENKLKVGKPHTYSSARVLKNTQTEFE